MADPTIDLNADLGEGFGRWPLTEDETLLSVVTSANVACGFHAGDPATMRRVCDLAAEYGVRIGAQVSYRDLAGFGRRPMDVPVDELSAEITYQVGALRVFAEAAGSSVSYVKPHGALYNRVARDHEQAAAVTEGVRRADPHLPLLGLPDSALHQAAHRAGLTTATEAFADRAYTADGTLLSRREPGAVIDDPDDVVRRAATLATDHTAYTVDGQRLTVSAQSLCLHGDTPGAAALARRVRDELQRSGVEVRPFR